MANRNNILKNKSFRALFTTQFLGALNDNIFKNALVVMITYKGVTMLGLDSKSVVALASGIFIMPFFFFSTLAGQISDRVQKSAVIRVVKWFEVAIMLVTSYGFYSHHYSLLMVGLFCMGLHSTFFGPTKYSLIPDLVKPNELTAGNAYIETGTFLAILIGTILGGLAAEVQNGEYVIIGSTLLVAVIGLITSYGVPDVAIADASIKIKKNIFPEIFSSVKFLTPNRVVFNSTLGISWFWFFGAALLSILPVLSKDLLHANGYVVTLFLATFTVGIGAGSLLCEKLSFQRVEIGLVPWGSIGMTIFLLDLAYVSANWVIAHSGADLAATSSGLSVTQFLSEPGAWRITFDLFMVSVFGGLFTVPLYTLIQERSEARVRSRVIAANNILNALFMVVSTLLLMTLYAFDFTLPQIIVVYAILNLIVAAYIFSIVPEFSVRFFAWALARLIYHVQTKDAQNIPTEGAALIVCNHVSFVDWLILMAAIQRPIRFVMYYKFNEIPLLKYLFRAAYVIPIAGVHENRALFNAAFETVSKDLRAGELVCIFPEGAITTDGELQEFKRGVEHILSRDPVPVVPIALKGLWGSIFSRKGGQALNRWPRRIWSKVDVVIGQPVPAKEATAAHLEKSVRELLN